MFMFGPWRSCQLKSRSTALLSNETDASEPAFLVIIVSLSAITEASTLNIHCNSISETLSAIAIVA